MPYIVSSCIVSCHGRILLVGIDLQVGSSKSTWVDLGLPSGVKSGCSSVTVEIFWRRRYHYKSFQVDLTNNFARSIVLYPIFIVVALSVITALVELLNTVTSNYCPRKFLSPPIGIVWLRAWYKLLKFAVFTHMTPPLPYV